MSTHIRYSVFEITDGGTLREPKETHYGQSSNMFDDYGTVEEAVEAISHSEEWNTYVVLPVVSVRPE